MKLIELSQIDEALQRHRATTLPRPYSAWGRAAVSLVLAGREDDLSLCLIKRARHPDDPFSGHMALPGGRASDTDKDSWSVAVRETHEEVGLALGAEHYLGPLSEMPIARQPDPLAGVLSPHVFYLSPRLAELQPDPREVAAAYWIALHHLCDPAHHTKLTWGDRSFSAIDYLGNKIWGLTLRVICAFAQTVELALDLDQQTIFDEEEGD